MVKIPAWVDDTRETHIKNMWTQKVMAWLLRTQPRERAELLIEGYLLGRPESIRVFELAASRMREEEQLARARGLPPTPEPETAFGRWQKLPLAIPRSTR